MGAVEGTEAKRPRVAAAVEADTMAEMLRALPPTPCSSLAEN